MKASALSHEMAKAITAATVAVPKDLKNMSPSLNGIMVSTETKPGSGRISFAATNLEQTIVVEVDAEIEERGHALIPAGPLLSLVKALGKGQRVEIVADEKGIIFTCGGTEVSLLRLREEEWPALPEVEGEDIILSLADSIEVNKIIHAVRSDVDPRYGPGLCCVHFMPGAVEATDTYRFARVDLPHDFPDALVPGPVVASALKFADDLLVIRINETHFSASTHYGEWVTNLTVGKFPDTSRIIRQAPEHHISINRASLRDPLTRALAISGNDMPVVDMWTANGLLTMHSELTDSGEVTDVLQCDGDLPEPLRLNVRYFADALAQGSSENVVLGIGSPTSPVTIKEGPYTELLMAIHATRSAEWKQRRAEEKREKQK